MSESILGVKIKAFDEFSTLFQKYQAELKKTQQTAQETAKGTDQLNKTTNEFFRIIGELGVLYAFKRGLQEIILTGKEFEKIFRQSQIIVGDFSDTLRNSAMSGKDALFTPTETVEAYRELGAAGLSTSEILESSNDVMNFSIAAMISMTDSSEALIAATKGFGLSFAESEQVVDAFSVAMDRTTLAGDDFTRALASIGPVAGGLAKQSLEDTLAIVAALKNMGARADDAATSVRSMLLQLINPTKEAADVMNQLGIVIYDSAGNLKSLPDIISQFETALAPLDEKSKQLVMTTVAGSDGIRALAAGLQTGSTNLKELSAAMSEGEGRAEQYAEIMGDTVDGSIRKVMASWEKAKILLFEDTVPIISGLLDGVLALVEGFNSLDETGRRLIETLVGSGGIGIAIITLISLVNKFRTAILSLEVMAGPPGWVIAGISLVLSGVIQLAGAQKESAQAQSEMNKKYKEWLALTKEDVSKEKAADIVKRIDQVTELITNYDRLIAKKKELNKELDSNLMDDAKQIADFKELRETETELDEVINKLKELGLTVEQARRLQSELNKTAAEGRLLMTEEAQAISNEAVETKKAADAKLELIQRYLQLSQGMQSQTDISKLSASKQKELADIVNQLAGYYPDLVSSVDEHGNALLFENKAMSSQIPLLKDLSNSSISEARARIEQERSKTSVVLAETRTRIEALLAERRALLSADYHNSGSMTENERQIRRSSGLIRVGYEMDNASSKLRDYETAINEYNKALLQLNNLGGTTSGGISWTPSSGKSGGKNAALELAQDLTDAIETAIEPYRNAVEFVSIAVGTLTDKEQFLSQILESGNGTAADALALNQTRVEQFVKLSQQQDALHQQAEAERVALAKVQEQLAAANNPEVVKELQSEMVNLERSIAQAGQAWVQAEQQKIAMMNRIKAEEEKRYSDAYQKAMDLMRHQINMANMSTEEQIRYLEKLRDAHEWTQQQMWELEESLYQLRRQQLTEMLDEIDEEYQSQLDRIEARTDKAAKAIQDQIDALDQTSQNNSRADAQYRYNQKIQELMDKRRYHELRTGKDHAEAIAEIDKEIAEAQREWELLQQEWAIEDQKESLQDQLEQVKEEGEKERDELEEHYRKAKRITESGVMDIIATLAATSPEWMNTGKQLIDALIAGLESGDFSNVKDIIDEVRDNDPETKTDPEIDTGGDGGSQQNPFLSITPASYRRYGNTTAMWSQNLAQLLGVSVSWDQSRGQVLIGGKAFTPLENDNGRTYVSIRQVAEALGYRVEWNDPNVDIYRAAKGGIFTKPALSWMAEAGGSEVALPLDRLQPMIDAAVQRALSQNGGGETTIIEHQYNAPLFNSEKTVIDDDTRSEVVARDIVGLQKSTMRGRGY